jgi:hypothetical protein
VGVNNVVEVHSDQSFGVQAAPLNSDEWEAMRRTVAGQQQARALLQGPELGAP